MRYPVKASGFTLIELLIVVVIITILSGMTLVVLDPQSFLGRGRDAHRQSDLDVVRAALEQYYFDNSRQYPDPGQADATADYNALSSDLAPYLDAFPTPQPNGEAYRYEVESTNLKCFELWTRLEEGNTLYEVCGGSLQCQNSNNLCDGT